MFIRLIADGERAVGFSLVVGVAAGKLELPEPSRALARAQTEYQPQCAV
jgi:hypothetical protein